MPRDTLSLAPPPAVDSLRVQEVLASLDALKKQVEAGNFVGVTIICLEKDYDVQHWTLTTRDVPLVVTLGAIAWAQQSILF